MRLGYDFTKVEKVAVVEVSGAVAGDAVKNQIGDFFAMELLKKGYTPVERAQVQTILAEQDFQASQPKKEKRKDAGQADPEGLGDIISGTLDKQKG